MYAITANFRIRCIKSVTDWTNLLTTCNNYRVLGYLLCKIPLSRIECWKYDLYVEGAMQSPIYKDSDMSSTVQYKIFWRHVIPYIVKFSPHASTYDEMILMIKSHKGGIIRKLIEYHDKVYLKNYGEFLSCYSVGGENVMFFKKMALFILIYWP
jgi:hypothetical protein